MPSSTGKEKSGPGVQIAALPYRLEGELHILLVTSRDTGRWVIPKGWPMKGRKRHAAAAQEAYEEAGVEGRIAKQAIGFYRYQKRLANGTARPCTVYIYPLEVTRQHKQWREQGQRVCRWFTLEEAAHAVLEPELQDMIHVFGASVGCPPTCEAGRAIIQSLAKAAELIGDS
jgi:8-oxo-dGTP pyrophosphatase MutT (NUDIX family)